MPAKRYPDNPTMQRYYDIVTQLSYPGLRFVVKAGSVPMYYLRVECDEAADNVTGEKTKWNGRKWYLSPHMTDGEIVQTAFKALLTALEHEAREQFKFMGQAVFDPHYDIYKLVELRKTADAIKERTHDQANDS